MGGLAPLRKKKRFLEVLGIRSNGAEEIGLGGQRLFENGGLQAMIRKRVNSVVLKLRYLILLVEINILIGLHGVKKEFDFKKAKA